MSKDVADNATEYYTACNLAQEQLAEVDEHLSSLYDSGISRVGNFEKTGQTRSFAYPISDYQSLNVEIKILYPEKAGDPFYKITSWMIVTTGSIEYDDSLPVFR